MFSFHKPLKSLVEVQIAATLDEEVSYPYQLRTRNGLSGVKVPRNYVLDHTRTQIGVGEEAYQKAKAAMKSWQHFHLGWVRVANPEATIAAGELIAVEAHSMLLWSVNISRILYVIDSGDEPNRFGYGYGTTPLHVERGEERFLIEYDPSGGAVHYDLLAISQPAHWLARLAYPYTRMQQRKFARESHWRMRQIASNPA